MNFFEILRNILQKTDPEMEKKPGFEQAFNSYMLIRYLSMRISLLPFAEIIQKFQRAGVSELDIYRFAYANIPVQNPFIKYIKAKTKSK